MFSLFHGLFTFFALGINKYDKTKQRLKNKEMAIQNNELTYYGSRGNEYLVENDKWVWVTKNNKGEDIIVDMKTDQEYYNLTQIKKSKHTKKYIDKGKTVRPKMYNEMSQIYYGRYHQMYGEIDIESDTPVDYVYINGIKFYINLENGKVLRPADGSDLNNIIGVHSVDDIISIINKRQEEIIKMINIDNQSEVNEKIFYKNRYIYIDKNKCVNVFLNNEIKKMQSCYEKDGLVYNKEKGRWI